MTIIAAVILQSASLLSESFVIENVKVFGVTFSCKVHAGKAVGLCSPLWISK